MTDTDNDPLFSSTENDQTPAIPENEDHDFLADLVGEGKKFKDVQSLAKSVLFKDMHIRDLEKENAEFRQASQQGLTREEFLEAIKSLKPSPSTPSVDEPERKEEVSLEQIASLVGKSVEERLALQQQDQNLQMTVTECKRRLGDNYQKVLRERAKELGEAPENLTLLARTRPKMFLELMAPTPRTETHVPSLPRGEVDLGKGQSVSRDKRNQSWYNELKKRDPKTYNSDKVQIQMHNDALSLGEKFFE